MKSQSHSEIDGMIGKWRGHKTIQFLVAIAKRNGEYRISDEDYERLARAILWLEEKCADE